MKHFNADGNIFPYFALILAVFTAIRLAKFNIDDRQTTSFIGMPVPADAIFWIGINAMLYEHPNLYCKILVTNIVIIAVVCIFSYLMVSKLQMFSLKFKNLKFGENVMRYFLSIGAILFVVSYKVTGFAWTILLYIAMSLFSKKQA